MFCFALGVDVFKDKSSSDILIPQQLHVSSNIPLLPYLHGDADGSSVATTIKPGSDKEWERRQLSSVWAPMPHTYQIHDRENGEGWNSHHRGNSVLYGDGPILETATDFLAPFLNSF